jgi:hypothetical protein
LLARLARSAALALSLALASAERNSVLKSCRPVSVDAGWSFSEEVDDFLPFLSDGRLACALARAPNEICEMSTFGTSSASSDSSSGSCELVNMDS